MSINPIMIAEATNNSMQGMLVSFGPFILIIIVMYFLLFRSQQKKNKEKQRLLDSMRVGDKVVTNAGLFGYIAAIKDKTITLKIAENVKIEILRTSISGVVEKDASAQA